MAMLLVLQQRRQVTAADLAAEFEVSVRTVYRDVAALMAAGVPVWTETGPRGGIRLVEGWRTRLDGLTGDEAAALFLAGAPDAVADLGFGAVLAAAQSKVVATLPPELRTRAARLRERFHLDAPGWFGQERTPMALAAVAEAVWASSRLDVTYHRADRSVHRRLDPLGLVLKAGTWYLVAAHRGRPRTYRVARIDDATSVAEPAERPEGFDLATWWAESSAEFDRSLLRYRCRVRLSPRGLRNLHHAVGVESARLAVESAGPADDEGWRVVILDTEAEDVAAHQLTGLGIDVEVLEPARLRRTLYEIGRTIAARHAAPE
jgi:predicted DNA-binding transcriptional regulator YafY